MHTLYGTNFGAKCEKKKHEERMQSIVCDNTVQSSLTSVQRIQQQQQKK